MVWIAHPVTRQIQLTAFYSLFEVHYEKGYEFPGESHNFWECLYVADGEVCVSGDERVYNLARGSIIFHKPLELHKFIVTGEKGADLFIFSFAAEGPLTAWLGEKVFALTDSQQKLLLDLYAFARQSAGNADSYRRYLEPFGRLPAYSQTAASYLELLMLSLAEAGAISSASSDPDAVFSAVYDIDLGSIVPIVAKPHFVDNVCPAGETAGTRIDEAFLGSCNNGRIEDLRVGASTGMTIQPMLKIYRPSSLVFPKNLL